MQIRRYSLRSILTLILIWLSLISFGNDAPMSASLAVAAPEVQPPNTFQATPCMFKGLELGIVTISPEEMGFECGYISVPEQHANPDGPTIRLPVAIRRATSTNPKPDPLFLAQGGPGGSAFEIFPITVPNTSIAAERDIVIFNQRGTVYAQPELVCTELRDAMPNLLALPPDEGEQKWQELLGECYQRLRAAGINLSAYNSLENAADVEVIRQTLGYDEFNFYGVSYGTLLGLHLIREYPQHLRSVILDSVVPTNLNFITQVPTSENRIYDELFQFCAERPSCAASYPDLEARFWAIVDQLNNSPTTLRLTHPDTGEQVTAYLDGDILLETVYQALYLSDSYAVFPKIVANLENNDYTFIQNIWAFIAFDRTFSEGMYYSVICAEDANFDPIIVGLDGLRSQIAARVPDDMQSYQDSCAVWPVDLLPSKVDEPVVSNIPTLLLSGRFDPITPPVFAATAAASLANAYNVVDPLTSHGVAFNHDCINQVVQDFLNNPTTEPDATCLTTQIPITVVPPNAITLPLLARVAELDRPFLTETAIGGLLLAGVLSAFVIWPIILVVNIILGKKLTFTTRQKWLHWSSRLLILVFGLLAVIFVAGLVGFVMYVLFSESSYLSAFTIPGTARPILLIPPLLLLLTISIVGIAGFIWHQKNWPRWDKVYYTFLAICALGYVIMLSIHGLLFV